MCVVGMKWWCLAQAGKVGLAPLCAQDLGWEEVLSARGWDGGRCVPRAWRHQSETGALAADTYRSLF